MATVRPADRPLVILIDPADIRRIDAARRLVTLAGDIYLVVAAQAGDVHPSRWTDPWLYLVVAPAGYGPGANYRFLDILSLYDDPEGAICALWNLPSEAKVGATVS
jgi:hypothetical protein